MKNVYWLSFAEPKKHLGVAVVEAEDPREAVQEAWRLNINPGGEVAIQQVRREDFEHCLGKFYTPEEIKAVWPESTMTLKEARERAKAGLN